MEIIEKVVYFFVISSALMFYIVVFIGPFYFLGLLKKATLKAEQALQATKDVFYYERMFWKEYDFYLENFNHQKSGSFQKYLRRFIESTEEFERTHGFEISEKGVERALSMLIPTPT